MRRIQDDPHQYTPNSSRHRNRHNPRENEQAHSLKVDCLDSAIAQADADGGTSDTHGCGDGERVLREEEDGDGGAHFHGGACGGLAIVHVESWRLVNLTSRGGVICDFVSHNLHDVVTVGDEADRDGGGEDSKLPHGDRGVLLGRLPIHPGVVDDSPGTNRVTDVVGAVRKGSSAGSEDLDEGVDVFDLVGILGSIGVDALHAGTLGRTVDAGLSSVDVVVQTVHETDDDHSGKTDEQGLDVLALVDLTGAYGVVVQSAHGPTNRSALLPELCMEPGLALGNKLLVGELLNFLASGSLFLINGSNGIVATLLQII